MTHCLGIRVLSQTTESKEVVGVASTCGVNKTVKHE